MAAFEAAEMHADLLNLSVHLGVWEGFSASHEVVLGHIVFAPSWLSSQLAFHCHLCPQCRLRLVWVS